MAGDSEAYYIGVDVGTGSVRAGLVSGEGKVMSRSVKDIKCWRNEGLPGGVSIEQSSEDIWSAVQSTIKVGTCNRQLGIC